MQRRSSAALSTGCAGCAILPLDFGDPDRTVRLLVLRFRSVGPLPLAGWNGPLDWPVHRGMKQIPRLQHDGVMAVGGVGRVGAPQVSGREPANFRSRWVAERVRGALADQVVKMAVG